MRIDFYNLRKMPFEQGLAKILQKAYASGERILLKVGDEAKKESVDRLLWEYDADSWLPHGTSDPENQPVFISKEAVPLNGASIIVIADGSPIMFEAGFSRCLYVFDGNNREMLETAREQYKQSLEKKMELQYHNL